MSAWRYLGIIQRTTCYNTSELMAQETVCSLPLSFSENCPAGRITHNIFPNFILNNPSIVLTTQAWRWTTVPVSGCCQSIRAKISTSIGRRVSNTVHGLVARATARHFRLSVETMKQSKIMPEFVSEGGVLWTHHEAVNENATSCRKS